MLEEEQLLEKERLDRSNIGNSQVALFLAVLLIQLICLNSLVFNIKLPGCFVDKWHNDLSIYK